MFDEVYRVLSGGPTNTVRATCLSDKTSYVTMIERLLPDVRVLFGLKKLREVPGTDSALKLPRTDFMVSSYEHKAANVND